MTTTSIPIDRAGTFNVIPRWWKVKRFDSSKAIAISVRYDIIEMYTGPAEGEGWLDWKQYGDYSVYADYFVVKKDGAMNTRTVSMLKRFLGWRDFSQVASEAPPNVLLQLKVEEHEYKGKVDYRGSWIDDADAMPGGGASEEDEASAKALDAQFGASLRAISAKPAASKKSAPAPAPKPAKEPSLASAIDETFPYASDDESASYDPADDVRRKQ